MKEEQLEQNHADLLQRLAIIKQEKEDLVKPVFFYIYIYLYLRNWYLFLK